jgi:hypothetical protein
MQAWSCRGLETWRYGGCGGLEVRYGGMGARSGGREGMEV